MMIVQVSRGREYQNGLCIGDPSAMRGSAGLCNSSIARWRVPPREHRSLRSACIGFSPFMFQRGAIDVAFRAVLNLMTLSGVMIAILAETPE